MPAAPVARLWCFNRVLLPRLLQRFRYPAHVVEVKHGLDLNDSTQSKEKGFKDSMPSVDI